MTAKNQFTPEEWRTLRETPLLASALVMLASPQGPLGVLREVAALSQAVERMLTHGAYFELIDALREDFRAQQNSGQAGPSEAAPSGTAPDLAQFNTPAFQSFEQAQKFVLDRCREAVQTLHLKAAEDESAYYRHGLIWVCWQVARAAREEGGFLGINSVAITEAEQQAVRKIAFALGVSAQEAGLEGDLARALPAIPVRSAPHAMADRFSQAEWEVLRQAPVWVGAAVTAASPSGTLGTIKELNALAAATQEVMVRFANNHLIVYLMDDMSLFSSQAQPVIETPTKMTPIQAGQRAVELCRQAAEILAQKASTEEASEYKQMLAHIAEKVARSAREGGVLGIGAQPVSQAERALLQELSAVLGIPL